MKWSARRWTLLACVVGAGSLIAVGAVPSLRFAYESKELRAVIEATTALVAAACAYLVYGRVRRSGMRNDLAIVFTLALSATTNLFFTALPDHGDSALTFQTWGRLLCRLLGAAVLAWAAVSAQRRLRNREYAGLTVVIAFDLALALVAVFVALFVRSLPQGIEVTVGANGKAIPSLWGHPALLIGDIDVFLLYLVAAAGFARRADRTKDPLFASLAVGSALAAFSWLHFAAYPSVFSAIVQVGDVLRLFVYLVLLLGAAREIEHYWGEVARAAAFQERRRLARDLHDGLAQELAFISQQTRLIARGAAPADGAEMVAGAAERALDEARLAITALTTETDDPFGLAVAHAAEEVAGRVGTSVRVDVADGAEVEPAEREALLRIVRESVTNAGRHGRATLVKVSFSEEGLLSIEDDGCGFDLDEVGQKGRFGLVSMRERAEGLGARFRVESRPGKGTTVEVGLP